jgi:hypothetical protein
VQGDNLRTVRLYEFPVLLFAEPVDWTPVSNPPDIGVQGFSKVDSGDDMSKISYRE